MKNSKKRGFTIVELVIVIAVIAILAGVLIPTFTSIIKKANEASDTALIKSLNTSLKADEVLTSKPATMYDALQVVKNDGYDLTKIKATASGNEILWDSVNNCFVYLKDDVINYIPDTYESGKQSGVALWKIVAASEELSATYSNYLADGRTGTITAQTGVDVGENTGVLTVTYNGSADVVIRTNSYDTDLTVSSGSVSHYGDVAKVSVNGTYREYGNARVATLTSGALNVESGANVTLVNAKAGAVEIKGAVEALAKASGATSSGNANITTAAQITEKTVAVIDGVAKETVGANDFKENTAIVLGELTDEIYNLENCTIIGQMNNIKANVVGSSNVTLKNINSTDVTVDNDFTGTLTFDGGKLQRSSSEESALLIDKNHSAQASYVFKNMTVDASTEKGIKICIAKSIVIENCVFDGTNLKSTTGGDNSQTRSLSTIDITCEGTNWDATTKISITITGCTFKNVPSGKLANDGKGPKDSDTAGAIKIKDQTQNYAIASVVIQNNTFIGCYRDVVIGKADETTNANETTKIQHVKTYNGSATWTISNNTSDSLADKGVLTLNASEAEVKVGKIGIMYGGCSVYDIANAYSDYNTYAVVKNTSLADRISANN